MKKKILLTVLLLAGVAMLVSLSAFRHYYSKLAVNSEKLSTIEFFKQFTDLGSNGVVNILLVGVDNDNADGLNDQGNADGLMILSICPDKKQIALTSLMRDIRVQVPDSYKTKLTLTYHFGGMDELIRTIEYNFGIQIDAYVMVNYLSVIDIVDAVGGIDVVLSPDEAYWMAPKIENLCELTGTSYDDNRLAVSEGPVTLNGIQTAAYLRIRYAGNGDFDRTGRARDVVMALKDKASQMNLSQIDRLAGVVLPCINTDLSQAEMLKLITLAPAMLKYNFVSERIPVEGSFWLTNDENGSFVDIDFETNRLFLQNLLFN